LKLLSTVALEPVHPPQQLSPVLYSGGSFEELLLRWRPPG